MTDILPWFIPIAVGLPLTILGTLKLYGFVRGVVGGADKPLAVRLCGT
jgi:hypothetical protein